MTKGRVGRPKKPREVEESPFNGMAELRRELREVNPWPKDLHFEDEKEIESVNLFRLSRPIAINPYTCTTKLICDTMKYLHS